MREPLRLRRVQAPARLPVTLDEIKAQLRLEDDQTFEDALVMAAVRSATEQCELSTGRALITQTWTLFRDLWPAGASLPLPRAPLQAIVQVKTFAQDDIETIWPAENYTADTAGAPGRLVARGGRSFPTPGRAANGIAVQFIAGYGDDPADVPEALRQGILQMAAYGFENRGDDQAEKGMTASGAAALWAPFRLPRL